jgi:pimeloyl-ACP methyl ester carboxylesterase
VVYLVVVAVAVAISLVSTNSGTDRLGPRPTGEAAPTPALDRYYHQDVAWSRCEVDLCARIRVPIDYAHPDDGDTSFAVRLRRASGGSTRRSIVINPGGPGGSGVDYVPSFVSKIGRSALSSANVVGFDPRGVAASDPVRCVTDAQFGRFLDRDRAPRDASEVSDLEDAYRRLAKACGRSGPLVRHLSTRDVARDLDVLRAQLGEQRLIFYGASYGTALGVTYRELYPTRVGRLVLDGALPPRPDPLDDAVDQASALDGALHAFLKDCLERGCPWTSSQERGMSSLRTLLARLDDRPLDVAGRKVTSTTVRTALIAGLYSAESWPALSVAISRVLNDDGAAVLSLADQYYQRTGLESFATNGSQVAIAIRCLDSRSRPSVEDVTQRLPELVDASPVFGAMVGWSALDCSGWIKPTRGIPRPTGNAGSKVLVVGSTGDPATPVRWARQLASSMKGAGLLIRVGEGHTALGMGSDCVDAAIRRQLVGPEPSAGRSLRCS